MLQTIGMAELVLAELCKQVTPELCEALFGVPHVTEARFEIALGEVYLEPGTMRKKQNVQLYVMRSDPCVKSPLNGKVLCSIYPPD